MAEGAAGTLKRTVLSDPKKRGAGDFDMRSWKGLTAVLGAARDAGMDADAYASFRDMVLEYAQSGGGDKALKAKIDQILASLPKEKAHVQKDGVVTPLPVQSDTPMQKARSIGGSRPAPRFSVTKTAASHPSSLQTSNAEPDTPVPEAAPTNTPTSAAEVPSQPQPVPEQPTVPEPEPAPPKAAPGATVPVSVPASPQKRTADTSSPESVVEAAAMSVQIPAVSAQPAGGQPLQTIDAYKARISEIKQTVNATFGNPIVLLESGVPEGKEYMRALLAAMKATGGSAPGTLRTAMASLETAFANVTKVDPAVMHVEPAPPPQPPAPAPAPAPMQEPPISASAIDSSVTPPPLPPKPTSPEPPVHLSPEPKAPTVPVVLPEEHPVSAEHTPEPFISSVVKPHRLKIVSKDVPDAPTFVGSQPLAPEPQPIVPTPPVPPPSPKPPALEVQPSVPQQPRPHVPKPVSSTPPLPPMPAEKKATGRTHPTVSAKPPTVIPSVAAPKTPVPPVPSVTRHPAPTMAAVSQATPMGSDATPTKPKHYISPEVQELIDEYTELQDKEYDVDGPLVTHGLKELLNEWSLFNATGIFGTGPSGIDSPLFKTLAPLGVAAVMAGRFNGSSSDITATLRDYAKAWQDEQGIAYTHTETFEHYLRRVVQRILKRQNSGNTA